MTRGRIALVRLSRKDWALLEKLNMYGKYLHLRSAVAQFDFEMRINERLLKRETTLFAPTARAAEKIVDELRRNPKGLRPYGLRMLRHKLERDHARKAHISLRLLRQVVGKKLAKHRQNEKDLKAGKTPRKTIRIAFDSDIERAQFRARLENDRKPISSNRVCRGTSPA